MHDSMTDAAVISHYRASLQCDGLVVRWHLTAHAANAVLHTSTCITGSQPCMHYL